MQNTTDRQQLHAYLGQEYNFDSYSKELGVFSHDSNPQKYERLLYNRWDNTEIWAQYQEKYPIISIACDKLD